MENIFQKISIADIPDHKFEGYYWYSNAEEPQVIGEEKIDVSIFTKLPFVIEANFYAKKENVSIQVKNIEGNYQVYCCNLNELPENNHCERQEYIAHDLGSVEKYIMLEAWEEKEDELLEDMKTLVPAWTAFVGFVK